MAVQLEIDDGNPWYLSPDIWVVPGDDPNGARGIPAVGQSSYVWALVHNRGADPVSNAKVRYWLGDPSTVITENSAKLIGTSNVTLNPGQATEVLCLTPWTPTFFNGGHECLIVQAYLEGVDDLPPHTPDDPFDPPDDPHTAQLNLNLIPAAGHMAVFPFAAGNAFRLRAEVVVLNVRRAPIETLSKVKGQLGLARLPEEVGGTVAFGLQPYQCGAPIEGTGEPKITVRVKPGMQTGLALAVKLPAERHAHSGAFFLIEQTNQDKVVGGIGVLVVSAAK